MATVEQRSNRFLLIFYFRGKRYAASLKTTKQDEAEATAGSVGAFRCSEAVGSDFEVTVKPVNIGKNGSLKKNYDDYRVVNWRRRIQPLDEYNSHWANLVLRFLP
jgi:hypothetical protein